MDTVGHDPDRGDGRALEVEAASSIWGFFCGAHLLPAVRGLDLGRRLAGQAGQLDEPRAPATSTSPAPASSTPSAASPALAGAIVLGPRIGKFDKDGKPRALPGHHIPMAMLGTFILLFGWFGFNAASTLRRHRRAVRRRWPRTRRSPAPFGAIVAMFWIMMPDRQARPGHDGQRHARRPGGDHRPVRLRRPVGGRRHRLHRRRPGDRGRVLRRAQAQDRRSGRRHRRARRLRHASACSPSASSPTAATAPAGTAPTVRRASRASSRATGGQFGAQALGAVVIWTVIFGVAFAFFKIQNALDEGRHPLRRAEDELAGLDLPEMGVLAYPEFQGSYSGVGTSSAAGAPASSKATVDA